MLRLKRLKERLGESLWFVPALLVLMFVAIALAAVYVDRNLVYSPDAFAIYGGSAEGAKTILSTIATSMLSLAVLVFSITLVVLQLASSQLTPRVIPLFLQDPWSKIAMGIFLGTFAYSLAGMWFVRTTSEENDAFVPVVTVSLAFLAVALSLMIFLNYINRVGHSIRLETIASKLARETLRSIEGGGFELRGEQKEKRVDEDAAAEVADALKSRRTKTIPAPTSALVVGISPDACIEWARENDAFVEILVPLGEFVVEGAPVVRVSEAHQDAVFPLDETISLDSQRAIALEPAYGLRELVDIAVRAISSGVNEPGMAVVVLDRVHEVLHRVGMSQGFRLVCVDSEGDPRVIVPRLSWEGWVSLGLREVLDYGSESVQVCTRVRQMLEDLKRALPPERHRVLDRYLGEVLGLPGSQKPFAESRGALA